ncbi:LysR family transcriptional regulator [Vibrio sp. DW001]|uniref:LysR family transcriptional regulator n=1 Tax=Vibrio sp. DW001 TaxID=2912315 RepID=UPI0023B099A0|nr:LysR family transcriptional regulator [Vibrio sp. DW001]WED29705.1 LysR family transcriptional regulator [Vibrio sp. DW001]
MDMNKLMVLLPEMAIFVVVIEEGSFSRAAIKLGVAPSSVSRSVARLENALQQKLIERTTRSLRLSTIGEEVFCLCIDMLNSAKSAVNAAYSESDTISGLVRVSAPKALARQVLSPIILDFLQTHPNVSIQIQSEDHFIDPIGNEVDVVIHITDKPVEGLVAKLLGNSRLVLCASPAYIDTHGVPHSPSDLVTHNCIRLGESAADRKWSFNLERNIETVNIDGNFAANHTEIRKDAVLRGLGISVFPEFTINELIQSGEVVEVLPDWTLNGRYQGQIVAQYLQSKYVPAQLKLFVEYLHEQMLDCR